MTTPTLNFVGARGTDAITPVPLPAGTDGPALGPAGNGPPGKATWFSCTRQAGPGHPGNDGGTAPPASSGGNGESAPGGRFACAEFVGDSLDLASHGGDGGRGASAGPGGAGSAGGDAGQQPKLCRDQVVGGTGGRGGMGGSAGNGGDAGSACDVTVALGSDLPGTLVSADIRAGTQGGEGCPGPPGKPGSGGLNSDGTQAPSGSQLGPGHGGTPGAPGYGGTYAVRTDRAIGARALVITLTPHPHG